MVRPSVVTLLLALLGAPVAAGVQLVETKAGKIYEAKEVLVVGDKLRMSLAVKQSGQTATVAIPIATVVPEFVYYAWASQVAEHDIEGHMRLAGWCRQQQNLMLGTERELVARYPRRLQELIGYSMYRNVMGHVDREHPLTLIGVDERPEMVWDRMDSERRGDG